MSTTRMTTTPVCPSDLGTAAAGRGVLGRSPAFTRTVLLLAIVVAFAAGWVLTGAEPSAAAVEQAGPELTHLLRAMAGLKLLMGAGLVAGVWWRLGDPVGPVRLTLYAAAAAAIAAGPALIWGMVHVGAGAALLHAGLAATLLLLWRDPATAARLAAAIAARRRALARRG